MATVNRCAPEDARVVIDRLRGDAAPHPVALGFDGYVDSLYRVVRTRGADGREEFFQTIAEYGARILDAGGRSADIDLRLQCRRYGGNAPLMAQGMAALGDAPTLLGALGHPDILPAFDALHPGVRQVSYAEPCQTIALEFNDGKVMMGDLANGAEVTWEKLRERLGEPALDACLEEAGLVALVNWCAHPGMPEIAGQVARRLPAGCALFLDLSDPTSLSDGDLHRLLACVRELGAGRPATLGMNDNEAAAVLRALFPGAAEGPLARADFERHAEPMRRALGLACVTVHANAYALACDGWAQWSAEGFHVERTRFSTGAGDHYNAAFCHGLVRGWPTRDCLLLAAAASSYFVRHGESPDAEALGRYLEGCAGAL